MAISFDQVPNSILVPGQYLEISNTGAVQGLFGMPSRILVIGQKYAAAPATAGVPTAAGRRESRARRASPPSSTSNTRPAARNHHGTSRRWSSVAASAMLNGPPSMRRRSPTRRCSPG